jgi:ElaB/YqjD/DUF883 family membrane-anchored ribosome-binding protein
MEMPNQAIDTAAPATQWLKEHRETLTTGGKKLMDGTGKYIAAHPLQSLGLALAAGYLIRRLSR